MKRIQDVYRQSRGLQGVDVPFVWKGKRKLTALLAVGSYDKQLKFNIRGVILQV